jgi:hypothetical protein
LNQIFLPWGLFLTLNSYWLLEKNCHEDHRRCSLLHSPPPKKFSPWPGAFWKVLMDRKRPWARRVLPTAFKGTIGQALKDLPPPAKIKAAFFYHRFY